MRGAILWAAAALGTSAAGAQGPRAAASLAAGAATGRAAGGEAWDALLAARLEGGWLLARGAVGASPDAGSAAGSWALVAPPLGGVRLGLVASGATETSARAGVPHEARSLALAARASRRFGRSGAWLGADVASASGSDVRPEERRSAGASAGLWRQLGGLIVGATLGARATPSATAHVHRSGTIFVGPPRTDSLTGRTVVDTSVIPASDSLVSAQRRWAEGEVTAYWSRGRTALDVAVGARLAAPGVEAARWARVGGSLALSRRVALVARAEAAPPRIAAPGAETLAGGRRRFALGLRLAALGAPAAARPVEIQPVPAAFRAERVAAGRYRVTVRVPRARTVELSADFTGWRPVALRRDGEDWWEATFDLAPGTYRVNVRVDGERWEAPPGLPVVADDFAGAVGVVVVQ